MKAHDVRRLCVCALCGDVADDRTAIAMKGKHFEEYFPEQYDLNAYWHPGCFVEKFGEGVVFNLARSEQRKFRLCDVSADTMQRLLEENW